MPTSPLPARAGPRAPESDSSDTGPIALDLLLGNSAKPEAPTWARWAAACLALAAQGRTCRSPSLSLEGLPGLSLPRPPVLYRDELQALEKVWPSLQTMVREPLSYADPEPEPDVGASTSCVTNAPINEGAPGVRAAGTIASASSVELTWLELPGPGTAEESNMCAAQAQAVELLVALQVSAAMRQGLLDAPPDEWLCQTVGLLNQVQAPYYPRYVVARNVLKESSLFERFRDALQGPAMCLNPGNSQEHRIRAIDPWLPKGHTLVDIGCGKATYLRILAHRYKKAIGFDADPYSRALAVQELQAGGLGHVKVFGSFDTQHYVPDFAHVLMTEVLEHMPLKTARELLGRLNEQNAERMVFTVPNREFNLQYGLAPGDFRHWDHHWEPNTDEFEALMRESFSAKRWALQFEPVGDVVDGISSGCLCVVKRLPLSVAAGRAVSKDWLQGLLA